MRPLPPVMTAVKDLLNLIELIKDPKRAEKIIKELRDVHKDIHDDLAGVESKIEADKLLILARAKKQEVDTLTQQRSEDIAKRRENAEKLYTSSREKLQSAELIEAQVKQLKEQVSEDRAKLDKEKIEFESYRRTEKSLLQDSKDVLKNEQESFKKHKNSWEERLKKAGELLA